MSSYYKLTFSRKSQDVKEILDEVNENKRTKVTDYICNAIRFFVKYKDLDIEEIIKFYEERKDFDFNNNLDYNVVQEMINNTIDRRLAGTSSFLVKDNNNEDEITITSDDELEKIDDDDWINIEED